MPLRRIIALVVCLAATYFAVQFRPETLGPLGPVFVVLAVLVAVIAFGAAVFNLSWKRYEDSDLAVGKSTGSGIGSLGVLVFAVVPMVIAVRGIYRGTLPAMGSGPDIAFAQSPMRFALHVAVWVSLGLCAAWLWWKVRISNKLRKEH